VSDGVSGRLGDHRAAARRHEDDAAAVLAVLAALRPAAGPAPAVARPPEWGRPVHRRIGTPGPGAWWASGLPR
jgi:Acyl-CoA carboxylase epsilon subunit